MKSDREVFMQMVRGEEPDFIPSSMGLFQMVACTACMDRPEGFTEGIDGFGVAWVSPKGQPLCPDPNQPHVLDDICDWEETVTFPNLDAIDWEAYARKDLPAHRNPNKLLMVQLTSGPFERLHDLMGFEEALVATLTEPEECKAFFTRFCDFRIEQLKYLQKYYKPDIVQFHDDWGSQTNLLFKPDFWQYAIKDNLKRVIDACHELGMLFNMHTCGKVDLVIDDLVALGPDLIDSMMVCNDLDRWMRDHGKSTVFMGGIDCQEVIDREGVTKKEIDAEIKGRIQRYAGVGNYFPSFYVTGDNLMTALILGAKNGYEFKGSKIPMKLHLVKVLVSALKDLNGSSVASKHAIGLMG